eukprot:2749452-Alexandrium_andersonii.AAC.1
MPRVLRLLSSTAWAVAVRALVGGPRACAHARRQEEPPPIFCVGPGQPPATPRLYGSRALVQVLLLAPRRGGHPARGCRRAAGFGVARRTRGARARGEPP